MGTRRARKIVIGGVATAALVVGAMALAPGAGAGDGAVVDSVVTTTDDYPFEGTDGVCDDGPNGTCSLREAVAEADDGLGGTITFGVDGTFPLMGDILVDGNDDIVIRGNGVDKTIIENEQVVFNFRGAGGPDRHFTVTRGTLLSISDMTLQGGSAEGGGSIWVTNSGELRTEDVHFIDNTAAQGGAIYADGENDTVTVLDTTFTGNKATSGGAIYINYDTVSIQNSTFTDNTSLNGAAIAASFPATVDIHWSTFSQNKALPTTVQAFRGFQAEAEYGTIFAADGADVTMSHSILEKLSGDGTDECTGAAITSGGANIVDDESCEFTEPLDLEGTAANVGPLQDNGGATFTMALAADSAAVDVDTALCKLNDQRDLPRNTDGDGDGTAACDSGAYELQAQPEETTTTSTTAPGGDVGADTATPATPTVARPTFTG